MKMLKSHKVFLTFWTPDQITVNECCSQLDIPEHFEIIDKLKTFKITQGFSYFFKIALNEFCVHGRISKHFESIDKLKNANISLDQCKKNILKKVAHDQPAAQLGRLLWEARADRRRTAGRAVTGGVWMAGLDAFLRIYFLGRPG